MKRYKIIIQYDGSYYNGWQIQKNYQTVQGVIENALKIISGLNNKIRVHGSGRTDAGVHALGQVAHFDLSTRLKLNDLQNALNSNLSENCRILNIKKINNDFHARYDAKKRYYHYQIYTGDSILYKNQAWLVKELDLDILNSISKLIIGTHDFLSFSKFRNDIKNTKCIIFNSTWSKLDDMFIYKISGNRFLHHMVRYLVGTIIKVSEGKYDINKFKSLLHEPRKNVQIHRAPSNGLILFKVEYDYENK